MVSGRLVNGYSKEDYILAVLARLSDAKWGVAGLQSVAVQGIENIECTDVLKWRGMVGRSLQPCRAPGVIENEVTRQIETRGKQIEEEMQMTEHDAEKIVRRGPEGEPAD